jgi:hypothetical protein
MIGSRRGFLRWRAVLEIVVALGCVAGVASAQAYPELQPGTRVRIRASNIVGQMTGKIASRTADVVVVDDERGTVMTLPFSELSDVQVSRGVNHSRGALQGAMWGGGLGLGAGLMFAALPNSARNSQSGFGLGPPSDAEGVFIGAGGGLVLGAALGALGGSERWERIRVPASIAVIPVRHGVGLRVTVAR